MDNIKSNFATNLKVVMEFNRINCAKLAQLVDIDQSTIRRMLSGERGCSLEVAANICKELNVNLHEMCFNKFTVIPSHLKAE